MILAAHTGGSLTSQHVKSESIEHQDRDVYLVLQIALLKMKILDNLPELTFFFLTKCEMSFH